MKRVPGSVKLGEETHVNQPINLWHSSSTSPSFLLLRYSTMSSTFSKSQGRNVTNRPVDDNRPLPCKWNPLSKMPKAFRGMWSIQVKTGKKWEDISTRAEIWYKLSMSRARRRQLVSCSCWSVVGEAFSTIYRLKLSRELGSLLGTIDK